MRPPAKNVVLGLSFIAVGSFFATEALSSLDLGNGIKLGPGAFPLVTSGLLVFFGAITAVGHSTSVTPNQWPVPWRGLALVCIAPIVFAITVRGLGLAPALGVAIFIAAFASRRITLRQALAVTVVLLMVTVSIFSFGLGLPYPLIGSWLGG